MLGIMFENQYYEHKALERFELENRPNFPLLDCVRPAITIEDHTIMLFCRSRVDDSKGALNDRPPSP